MATQNALRSYLVCSGCQNGSQIWEKHHVECKQCGHRSRIDDDIPRYVDGAYHSSFGLQWNKFSTVQLDSVNGSLESERRLLNQSKLDSEDFEGKTILEVGAGNGRFTEVFLKYGARVVAVDYSSAIDANKRNHRSFVELDRLMLVQADLFNLPLINSAFDFVFCYGVIQHTGNNQRAIIELSKFAAKEGRLFLDIYSTGIRHFNPFIYLARLVYSLLTVDDHRKLELVGKFVRLVFPLQLRILRALHKKEGLLKYLRWIINRSPNSVYGIHLFLDGQIDIDCAYQWSVMDTFDAWAPKHDHPVSERKWKELVSSLKKEGFRIDDIDVSGQGHTAALTRVECV